MPHFAHRKRVVNGTLVAVSVLTHKFSTTVASGLFRICIVNNRDWRFRISSYSHWRLVFYSDAKICEFAVANWRLELLCDKLSEFRDCNANVNESWLPALEYRIHVVWEYTVVSPRSSRIKLFTVTTSNVLAKMQRSISYSDTSNDSGLTACRRIQPR